MVWSDRVIQNSDDATERVEDVDPGRLVARLLAKILFVVLAVGALLVSLRVDIIAVTILASVVLAQALYVILPIHDIRDFFAGLWTGEAGEDAYEDARDGSSRTGGRVRRWFK